MDTPSKDLNFRAEVRLYLEHTYISCKSIGIQRLIAQAYNRINMLPASPSLEYCTDNRMAH